MNWSSKPEFGFQDNLGQRPAPQEFSFQEQDGGKKFNQASQLNTEIALQQATPGVYQYPVGPVPQWPAAYGVGAMPMNPYGGYFGGRWGGLLKGALAGALVMGLYTWWGGR